jgi:hypothetical protein
VPNTATRDARVRVRDASNAALQSVSASRFALYDDGQVIGFAQMLDGETVTFVQSEEKGAGCGHRGLPPGSQVEGRNPNATKASRKGSERNALAEEADKPGIAGEGD